MRTLLKPRDAFLPPLHAGEGWIVRAGGIADVLPQKEARGNTLADHHKKTDRHSGEGRNPSPVRSMDSGLRRNDDEKPSTIARNGDFA